MYNRNYESMETYLQAALQFFEELTQSMGPDVKFKIRNIYERGASGAGAIWHLGSSI